MTLKWQFLKTSFKQLLICFRTFLYLQWRPTDVGHSRKKCWPLFGRTAVPLASDRGCSGHRLQSKKSKISPTETEQEIKRKTQEVVSIVYRGRDNSLGIRTVLLTLHESEAEKGPNNRSFIVVYVHSCSCVTLDIIATSSQQIVIRERTRGVPEVMSFFPPDVVFYVQYYTSVAQYTSVALCPGHTGQRSNYDYLRMSSWEKNPNASLINRHES